MRVIVIEEKTTGAKIICQFCKKWGRNYFSFESDAGAMYPTKTEAYTVAKTRGTLCYVAAPV